MIVSNKGVGIIDKKINLFLIAIICAFVFLDDVSAKQIKADEIENEITERDKQIIVRHVASWEGYEILPYNNLLLFNIDYL